MHNLLITYYGINGQERKAIEGKPCYNDGEYIYFITLTTGNKDIHIQQTSLANHLTRVGHFQVATLVTNIYGDLVTNVHGKQYVVIKVKDLTIDTSKKHGILLGEFHQSGCTYPYEPKSISSYGAWKKLWIDKCTFFEEKIAKVSREHPNDYYRLLINVLPYMIGVSENAIQYIRESEQESRHDLMDQGTIAFQRYQDHLLQPIIWQTDLVYDHLTRDLAEHIRLKFLQEEGFKEDEVWNFLGDYQSVIHLTPFSWRLLFARLLFPVHLYDCMERAFYVKDFHSSYGELSSLLDKQGIYDQRLNDFMLKLSNDQRDLRIPNIPWLSGL